MSLANWPCLSRKVVVTGIGAVTPLGHTFSESWQVLLAGKSGIAPISLFNAESYSVRFAGEVKNFPFEEYIPKKEQRKMGRMIKFGAICALQAWEDAGFKGKSVENNLDPNRVGTYMSSGMCDMEVMEKNSQKLLQNSPISPFFLPSVINNLTSGNISIMLQAQGHSACITSACASGAHSIGESALLISRGDADIMIAGGTEGSIAAISIAGFGAMKALSTRNDEPEKASRPFDRDRDGFVIAEGGGAVILEEYEHAKKRNAHIYGEVAGYASSADAYHITAPIPEGKGIQRCVKLAFENGKVPLDSVDYINAHATSTPGGDTAESIAIENLFGAHAKKLLISSTKSMTGHLLGGAGAVESCFALKALETGDIPPTINLDNVDEQCRLNYVANEAVQKKCKIVVNNSFGFGGTNVCLIFAKV